jgi:hypothetical protein
MPNDHGFLRRFGWQPRHAFVVGPGPHRREVMRAWNNQRRHDMPLFFLIAIGAGAFTLGAATVDVANDGKLGQTNYSEGYSQPAPAQQAQVQVAPQPTGTTVVQQQ